MNTLVKTNPWPSALTDEIAFGMEEPQDVAFRFGIVASEYKKLAKLPAFANELAGKKAAYERDGITAEIKARMFAEHLMDDYFVRLKSPDTTLPQLESGINTLARIGQMGQKKQDQQAAATGSSVQIIFTSGAAPMTVGAVIEAKEKVERVWDLPAPEKVIDPLYPEDTNNV